MISTRNVKKCSLHTFCACVLQVPVTNLAKCNLVHLRLVKYQINLPEIVIGDSDIMATH